MFPYHPCDFPHAWTIVKQFSSETGNLGLLRNQTPNTIFTGSCLTTSCQDVILRLHDQSETAQCDITWHGILPGWAQDH